MQNSFTEITLRRLGRSLLALGALALLPLLGWGQVSLTSTNLTYSQNFNTLGVSTSATTYTWTDNTTLAGWYSNQTQYTADNGNSSGARLHSHGASSSAANDRALGVVSSGSATPYEFAVRLANNTGSAISSVAIQFTGEQWRQTAMSGQALTFSYAVNPAGTTSSSTGSYTTVASLQFTAPQSGTAVEIDGNATANQSAKSATLPVSVPAGNELWLKWTKVGTTSPGLAIDDFSVTATPAGTITAAPNSTFTAFTTQQGTFSAAQTYTLTGSNLTASIMVTAPSGYEVAQSASSSTTTPNTYASSQTVTQSSGSASATIYVRLTGTTAGIYGTSTTPVSVTNASTGVTTQNVSVYGNTTSLSTSSTSLTGFSTTQGAASTAQSYTLSGAGLTADVTVTPPAGYEVSQTSASAGFGGDATAITVTQSSGSVSKTIYVRLTGTTAGTYGGDVANASTGATTRNVAVSGTVAASTTPTPTLSASPNSLSGFNALAGSYSAAQSYTLTGSNLTGSVAVTAPTGYEVSQDGGVNYAATQTVVPSGGSVNTSIAVRLANAAAAGTASGNVGNASCGATTVTVAVGWSASTVCSCASASGPPPTSSTRRWSRSRNTGPVVAGGAGGGAEVSTSGSIMGR